MTISRRSGSNWVIPSNIRRRSGSSWVDVQNIYRRSGNTWITVYTAYTAPTASVSPTTVLGSYFGSMPPPNITTNNATATASGGTGNYTYTWERVSGSTLFFATAPNNAITAFQINTPPVGTTSAVYRCRINDGVTTVYTPNVSVSATYTWSGGGPIDP